VRGCMAGPQSAETRVRLQPTEKAVRKAAVPPVERWRRRDPRHPAELASARARTRPWPARDRNRRPRRPPAAWGVGSSHGGRCMRGGPGGCQGAVPPYRTAPWRPATAAARRKSRGSESPPGSPRSPLGSAWSTPSHVSPGRPATAPSRMQGHEPVRRRWAPTHVRMVRSDSGGWVYWWGRPRSRAKSRARESPPGSPRARDVRPGQPPLRQFSPHPHGLLRQGSLP
jgi:hypothetical protein